MTTTNVLGSTVSVDDMIGLACMAPADNFSARCMPGEVSADVADLELSDELSECVDWAWLDKTATPRLKGKLRRKDTDTLLIVDRKFRIPFHGTLLSLTSDLLADVLELQGSQAAYKVLRVEGDDAAGWLKALAQLYPMAHPKPRYSWGDAWDILPIAHKYDIKCLLSHCLGWVLAPAQKLSSVKKERAYCWRWLELAEQLQLDKLRKKVMEYVSSEINQHRALMLGDKEFVDAMPRSTHAEIIALVAKTFATPRSAFHGTCYRLPIPPACDDYEDYDDD